MRVCVGVIVLLSLALVKASPVRKREEVDALKNLLRVLKDLEDSGNGAEGGSDSLPKKLAQAKLGESSSSNDATNTATGTEANAGGQEDKSDENKPEEAAAPKADKPDISDSTDDSDSNDSEEKKPTGDESGKPAPPSGDNGDGKKTESGPAIDPNDQSEEEQISTLNKQPKADGKSESEENENKATEPDNKPPPKPKTGEAGPPPKPKSGEAGSPPQKPQGERPPLAEAGVGKLAKNAALEGRPQQGESIKPNPPPGGAAKGEDNDDKSPEEPDETSESDETVSEEIAEVVGSYGKEIISKLMRKKNLACEKRERREEKAEEAMEKKVTKEKMKEILEKVSELLRKLQKNFEDHSSTFKAIKASSAEGKTSEAWKKLSTALQALRELNVKAIDQEIMCTLYSVAVEAEEAAMKGFSQKDFDDGFKCASTCHVHKNRGSDTEVLAAAAEDYECFVTAIKKFIEDADAGSEVDKDMDGAMAQLLQPLSILEKMMKETDFMKCALQRFKEQSKESEEEQKVGEAAKPKVSPSGGEKSEKPAATSGENKGAEIKTPTQAEIAARGIGRRADREDEIKRIIEMLKRNQ